jgi:hypothetical protein
MPWLAMSQVLLNFCHQGALEMDALLYLAPPIAAAGYSLVYLLAGGGFFGAFVIFVVAKMLGR